MRRLQVFNNVSLDGYFTGADGDFAWAHAGAPDPEFDAFVAGNAGGGGALLFGRVTYGIMASWWPTPAAAAAMPEVAAGMNRMEKFVVSRTLRDAAWNHTRVLSGELVAEVRALKQSPGEDLTILGSGSLVGPLAAAGLIDGFQLVVVPVVLGAGRTMFEGVGRRIGLRRTGSRGFANGKVVLTYEPAD